MRRPQTRAGIEYKRWINPESLYKNAVITVSSKVQKKYSVQPHFLLIWGVEFQKQRTNERTGDREDRWGPRDRFNSPVLHRVDDLREDRKLHPAHGGYDVQLNCCTPSLFTDRVPNLSKVVLFNARTLSTLVLASSDPSH